MQKTKYLRHFVWLLAGLWLPALGWSQATQHDILLLSPYQFGVQQISRLENLCDSLERSGVRDERYLQPLAELTEKLSSLNPLKGLDYAEKGIQISQEEQLPILTANFYTYKGHIFRARGYQDLALEAYTKSHNIRKGLPEDDHYYYSFVDIGNIYYDQLDYRAAKKYYQLAYEGAVKLKLPLCQAVAINNMGLVARQTEQYAEAKKYFERATQIRLAAGYVGLSAHAKNYLTGLAFRTGEYEKGVAIANEVIDTMLKYDVTSELVDAYCNKGKLLAALGRYAEANEVLEKAHRVLLEHNMSDKLNFYHGVLADIALFKKDYKEAERQYFELLSLAKSIDNLLGAKQAYQNLHALYKQQGLFEKSLAALEEFNRITDEIRNQEVDRKLLAMEARNSIEAKERELLLSQQELAANKVQTSLLIAFISLATLALLLIAYLLYQKNKANKSLQANSKLIEEQNQALILSKAAAEKHLKAKSDFLSQMSHEIRTPINSILGLSELLIQEAQGSETLDKLQSIRYSVDILLVIINDILDLASIEEGKIKLEWVDTDLRRLCKELKSNMEAKAVQKGLTFNIEIDDRAPAYVISDPTRLYQILLNLASNAVKFTEKGRVDLKIEVQDLNENQCTLHFAMHDTGIGIAEAFLPHIFKSFSQGGSDIHRRYGGTGLGLSITKRLVEMLGGEVKVSSIENQGSVFSFALQFEISQNVSTENTVSLASHPGDLSGLKLLYVEDNLMNQKVMGLLLKRLNVIPVLASNGQEAIRLLEKRKFDLVLMDFRMPVMDGFEATSIIRDPKSAVLDHQVPVIGVTADVFDESTYKGLACGMNAILPKPIDKDKLYQILQKHSQAHMQISRAAESPDSKSA